MRSLEIFLRWSLLGSYLALWSLSVNLCYCPYPQVIPSPLSGEFPETQHTGPSLLNKKPQVYSSFFTFVLELTLCPPARARSLSLPADSCPNHHSPDGLKAVWLVERKDPAMHIWPISQIKLLINVLKCQQWSIMAFYTISTRII